MTSKPAALPGEIAVGDVLDRYEIVRHVSRGGMGSVWLARFEGKHGFAKHVAIKTILPELAGDPQFRAMFLEEARISSRLAHVNVAQVLDVGEHAGTVYIAFEWVEGRSLGELCAAAESAGERIPVPLLLRVVADACAGLHAAHELTGEDGAPLGLVHRDVTPQNVLVSERGFAKVIDFGIAKTRDRVAGETRSGFVKGTPQYMAPEAALRSPLDRRADVWSLGAVMFRALAGAPPFDHLRALVDVMDGVEKMPRLPESAPAEVRAIVARAMSLDRAKRFATADEMKSAVERALHGTSASPREIDEAASLLVATCPTTEREPTPGAPPPTVIAREPGPPAAGTLLSPGVAPKGSVSVLAIVVAIASLVTAAALVLALLYG